MFCKNCGNQVPDEANVCPNCGTPLTQTQQPYTQQPYTQQPTSGSGKDSNVAVSLACGITGIVVSVLGGIMFGVFGGIIGMILGIIAVIAGTNARKNSNNTSGSAGFICGLLALIFGVIFTFSCAICNCSDPTGLTCYGCVGGTCKGVNDVGSASKDLYDALEELEDYNW